MPNCVRCAVRATGYWVAEIHFSSESRWCGQVPAGWFVVFDTCIWVSPAHDSVLACLEPYHRTCMLWSAARRASEHERKRSRRYHRWIHRPEHADGDPAPSPCAAGERRIPDAVRPSPRFPVLRWPEVSTQLGPQAPQGCVRAGADGRGGAGARAVAGGGGALCEAAHRWRGQLASAAGLCAFAAVNVYICCLLARHLS